MNTSQVVEYVFNRANNLLVDKEFDYEDTWIREGIPVSSASALRKASSIEVQLRNGVIATKKPKILEDLLDLMNYCALTYALVDLGPDECRRKLESAD